MGIHEPVLGMGGWGREVLVRKHCNEHPLLFYTGAPFPGETNVLI